MAIAYMNGGIIADESDFVESALAQPIKDGYKFEGWYTDENLTTAFSNGMPSVNSTYYAKWTASTGYDIGESNIIFGSMTENTTPPAGESVTVSYTGGTGGSISSVECSNDAFEVTSSGLVVTITPKSGLTPGAYNGTVYICTGDGATHWINVSLTVAPASAPDPGTPSTPTNPPVWVRPGGDLMITRLPDGVNNAPVLVTITLDRALYGSYGGIEFTGGVAEVLLAPGGTAYVSDLPAGAFYTVSVPGGTILSSDNLSGIIPVDGAAQAGFTAIPGSDDFEIVESEGDEEGDVQEGTEETVPEEGETPEEGLEELPEEGETPAEEGPVDVPKTGDVAPTIGLALVLGLAACAVVLHKARAK